jgi:hypothetical protein
MISAEHEIIVFAKVGDHKISLGRDIDTLPVLRKMAINYKLPKFRVGVPTKITKGNYRELLRYTPCPVMHLRPEYSHKFNVRKCADEAYERGELFLLIK